MPHIQAGITEDTFLGAFYEKETTNVGGSAGNSRPPVG
jgi:hypothetical protein